MAAILHVVLEWKLILFLDKIINFTFFSYFFMYSPYKNRFEETCINKKYLKQINEPFPQNAIPIEFFIHCFLYSSFYFSTVKKAYQSIYFVTYYKMLSLITSDVGGCKYLF